MGYRGGPGRAYLDLPTWRSLPSGWRYYVTNIEDAREIANKARDEYIKTRNNPNSDDAAKRVAMEDYQAAKQFVEDFPNREIRQNERPQEQFVFPLEFNSPSGHKYVFDNWQELQYLEKPENLAKVVDYEFSHDRRNRTKEQIAEEVKKDIVYLRKKREEVYERGWLGDTQGDEKGLTQEEAQRLKNEVGYARLMQDIEENAARTEKENEEKYLRAGVRNEYEYNQLMRQRQEAFERALNTPPAATAAPTPAPAPAPATQAQQAAPAPAPIQQQAAPASAPVQQQAAPAQAPQTQQASPAQPRAQVQPANNSRQARTRENFYGIDEPNYPINIAIPDDIGNLPRNINIQNRSHYESALRVIQDEIMHEINEGNAGSQRHKNLGNAVKLLKSEYNNALNQRRERETPQYVTNPDGTVIDTRTHEIVDPERVQLASVQERSRQLTNRPFEENPYEARPTQVDPLLERGVDAVEQGFLNEHHAAPLPQNNFRYPNRNAQQELASASYMRPNTGRHGFETLRDSILEDSRQRAMRRFNRSMEDLGRQFSANRMGRNTMFDHMASREFGDVMRDQNVLDHETELRLRALDENMRSGRAQFADSQYERNAQRALEEYRTNQLREEREHARRRQAASDAIAAGTLRQNMAEQNRARQSAEFMRRQNHPRSELNSHLDTLRAASLGLPQMQQEERRNIPMPRLVPQAAPPTLERENAPYGAMPPAQAPTPNPDTTFRDIAGVVLGAGELGMNMAANRRNEQAHRANMAAMARQSANAVQPTSNTGTT